MTADRNDQARATRIGLGRRGGWAGLVAGIGALGLLEAAVLHFLAHAFLPTGIATAVDLVAAALTVLVIVALASPLWGWLRVDATGVRLRFGWLAAIDIPAAAIADVREQPTDIRNPVTLGLDFDSDTGLLTVVRAPSSPLIRITLTTEIGARTQGWRRVQARAVLASVDNIDALDEYMRR
ncbi:hypothetical protein [Nocardia cyriacigeorgica]|uniref:hypothetical protein n=1 Tax=Nocardia cyriacigeorgica TaxID=135487 RepID=UPI0035133883